MNNSVQIIQKVDRIYKILEDSPTARMLVNQAPAILQEVRGLAQERQQLAANIEALIVNRQYDLQRFDRVAPALLTDLRRILDRVFECQDIVQSRAHLAAHDDGVRLELDYLNNEIDRSIQMFNNLTFHLLNS